MYQLYPTKDNVCRLQLQEKADIKHARYLIDDTILN